jgi:hypothetical protein
MVQRLDFNCAEKAVTDPGIFSCQKRGKIPTPNVSPVTAPTLEAPIFKVPTIQCSCDSKFLRLKVLLIHNSHSCKVISAQSSYISKFLLEQSYYWFNVPTFQSSSWCTVPTNQVSLD